MRKYLSILVICIILLSIVYVVRNNFNNNTLLDDVSLKEDSSSKSGMFAIMVENDDGEYEEYTDSSEWPTGMVFNEENSGCIDSEGNSVSATLSYSDGYVSVITNDRVYCYLYFDIYELNCVDEGVTSVSECILRSENNSQTEAAAITYIKSKGTPDFSSTATTDEGLYYATDDYGDSYYFRGAVTDNYVYFAGYYWRIIRINGDGSIRMIYQGLTADATGDDAEIGKAAFNTTHSDPTYVGYMYGSTSSTPVTQSSAANFTNFSASAQYYFSTSYEEVGDGTFKLSGSIISGTFSELFGSGGDYEDTITNYYSCFNTSSDKSCTLLMKLNVYNSSTNANVYYISYASTSYEDTLTNLYSSNIKKELEDWYEQYIYQVDDDNGNYWSDYVSTSATFCGDRSVYSGSGYLLSETTSYNANRRLTETYLPILGCSQISDLYSVHSGTLTYPIGLVTADEASFAGSRVSTNNTKYYLYTGNKYWTMTPCNYVSFQKSAGVFRVDGTGYIYGDYVTTSLGVRPVINLSSSVILTSGDGTMNSPYEVSLQ